MRLCRGIHGKVYISNQLNIDEILFKHKHRLNHEMMKDAIGVYQ